MLGGDNLDCVRSSLNSDRFIVVFTRAIAEGAELVVTPAGYRARCVPDAGHRTTDSDLCAV
jgi:hypothetical protein